MSVKWFRFFGLVLAPTWILNAQQADVAVSTADMNATPETRALFFNLMKLSGHGILFGHQDDTAYGVGWRNEELRSDVRDVCGSFPAVCGWDLGNFCHQNVAGHNDVEFEKIRKWIIDSFERGAVNTMSWHWDNPVTGGNAWETTQAVKEILPGGRRHGFYTTLLDTVSKFFGSLKTKNGVLVPVVFRPFHEHTGRWFWWGEGHCTEEEYKQLWQFTVEYLRDVKGVHNLLYAYSPDQFFTEKKYLERYPGDAYVDVLGHDNYWGFNEKDKIPAGLNQLRIVVRLAEKKAKIPALTETGLEGIPIPNWWTETLLDPIRSDSVARKIVWLLVWRNANKKHHYAPYPGHPSVPDFLKFEADPYTLFEKDLPKMYGFDK